MSDTGQTLADYAEFWDRPTEDVMADGPSRLEVEAVKDALAASGYPLKYPNDHGNAPGWHRYKAGEAVPADWADPKRYAEEDGGDGGGG